MVRSIKEGERVLFGAQNARPVTIEMAQTPTAEDDSVLRRDDLRAVPARRGLLFCHGTTPMQKGMSRTPLGWTPACVNPVLQWWGDARIASTGVRPLTLGLDSPRAGSCAGDPERVT